MGCQFVKSFLICSLTLLLSCQKKPDTLCSEQIECEHELYTYRPINQKLYDTIVSLNDKFWRAWNDGDYPFIENILSNNHEFYHDRGGVRKGKQENLNNWRKFFKNRPPQRGKYLNELTEVYEIPGFGALQVGYQQFFNERYPEGTTPARVVTLWKSTSEGWKQEYVFSTHKHPLDHIDSIHVKMNSTGNFIRMPNDFKYKLHNLIINGKQRDTLIPQPQYSILLYHKDTVYYIFKSTGRFIKVKKRWRRIEDEINIHSVTY